MKNHFGKNHRVQSALEAIFAFRAIGLIAGLLALGFGLVACSGDNPPAAEPVSLATIEAYSAAASDRVPELDQGAVPVAMVAAQNQLVVDLFRLGADTNFVAEALSLKNVLGMLAGGASSLTADQIGLVFPAELIAASNFSNSFQQDAVVTAPPGAGEAVKLDLHNRAWGQSGYLFQKTYLQSLFDNFNSDLSAVDFVNQGSVTQSLLAAVPTEKTRLLLSSDLAIQSTWAAPFNEAQFVDGLFEYSDATYSQLPLLSRQGVYNSYEDEELSAFELPLNLSDLSMVVLMPKSGRFAEVKADLENRLPVVMASLQPHELRVLLPRFSLVTSGSMNRILSDWGIGAAFDENSADFSGINGLGYLYLEKVTHSATLDFAETGLQAQAETLAQLEASEDEPDSVWDDHGVVIGWNSVGVFPFDICLSADDLSTMPKARPFIYALQHKPSGALLFVGQIKVAGETVWTCPLPNVSP
jgi:serine protease inhibitor